MQAAVRRLPGYEQEIRQALASPVRDDHTAARIVAAFLAA
jgi:hypothetical protein